MSAPVAVGMIAGALVIGLPLMVAAGALETRHRVANVAESAALAAADTAFGWVTGDPCDAAERVVATAGSTIESCFVAPMHVTVTVSAQAVFGTVRMSATAGVILE